MKRLVRAGLSFPSSHHLPRAITIRAALRRMTETSASVDHGPRSSEQVEEHAVRSRSRWFLEWRLYAPALEKCFFVSDWSPSYGLIVGFVGVAARQVPLVYSGSQMSGPTQARGVAKESRCAHE